MSEPKAEQHVADITVTVILLIGHVVLAFYSFLWVGLSVMGLDPCGYVPCGDERWANIGVETAMFGGVVLVFADVIASSLRMSRRKRAWFIPVLFCVAQAGVAVAGFVLVSWAGPV